MSERADTLERTEAETSLARTQRHAGEPEWLENLRGTAMAQFGEFGLPHKRVEAWKYTDVRAKLLGEFGAPETPVEHGGLQSELDALLGDLPAIIVQVSDGHVIGWSKSPVAPPEGVEILSFADAIAHKPDLLRGPLSNAGDGAAHSLRALNTGLAREGIVVSIADGVTFEPVIVLAHLSAPKGRPAFHLRHLVNLGRGASASVLGDLSGRQ